ncbi:hypothetical protein [Brachyspira hampsonii]|uniref:hypothetical protein n=1 Tax=Brachyspira hampsonii TaxID=1287055 RepID=UPI00115D534B|nr:hypothetical protein [Brachyspira hampsonii]
MEESESTEKELIDEGLSALEELENIEESIDEEEAAPSEEESELEMKEYTDEELLLFYNTFNFFMRSWYYMNAY